MAKIYFLKNDEEAGLKRLRDKNGFINDAMVTLTIKDFGGTDVGGIVWPLAIDYVEDSDGLYEIIVDKAITLTEGATYYAEYTIVTSYGRDGFWKIEFIARERTS